MNSAEYVSKLIEDMKAQGKPLSGIAWEASRACVGWAYVYGARGQYCTPANRRAKYSDAHSTIKTACKNFNGSGSEGCVGCKWYPGNKYTRFFDCRGFTYWVLKAVYGWELQGVGCTSQWNNASNWKAKGEISTMPKNTLVCLFYRDSKDPKVMAHTGFGLNGETVECSSGVQYSSKLNKKWQYWAVPKCSEGEVTPEPAPDPVDDKRPTLRKGDKGTYVTLAQELLIQRRFSCGSCGADGVFGSGTLSAVKKFQQANGLQVDGVIGPKTWGALENTAPVKRYTVTVQGLTLAQAEAIKATYSTATIKEEGD